MIYLVKGRQRKGKTTVAIGIALWYHLNANYPTSDIVSNVTLYKPNGEELREYKRVDIAGMRLFVREMVTKQHRHKILIIDEIDRVFPHRFWNMFQQTETLLGLWQDEKLFNVIIGTAHIGRSVDLLIRESMQIEVFADLDKFTNTVNLVVINALDQEIYDDCMFNARLVQDLFNSWEPVS